MSEVDLVAEARRYAKFADAVDGGTSAACELLLKLADQVVAERKYHMAAERQMGWDRQEIIRLREELGKIQTMTVTHRTTPGWNRMGEIARAALAPRLPVEPAP